MIWSSELLKGLFPDLPPCTDRMFLTFVLTLALADDEENSESTIKKITSDEIWKLYLDTIPTLYGPLTNQNHINNTLLGEGLFI